MWAQFPRTFHRASGPPFSPKIPFYMTFSYLHFRRHGPTLFASFSLLRVFFSRGIYRVLEHRTDVLEHAAHVLEHHSGQSTQRVPSVLEHLWHATGLYLGRFYKLLIINASTSSRVWHATPGAAFPVGSVFDKSNVACHILRELSKIFTARGKGV